jgi:hypothetical protein
MSNGNQDEVCTFVREIVAARTGELVTLASRPELEDRASKTVEEVWASPNRAYAIEHTRIEAFEQQIGSNRQLTRLLGPLRQSLAGKLPGTFVLAVQSAEAMAARVRYKAAQDEAVRLVLEAVPGMAVGAAVTLRSDQLQFTLELWRRHEDGSKVVLRHLIEGDEDPQRLQRIRVAFDRKLPKLLAWSSEGRETVLALESDDPFHSNYQNIFRAVATVVRERPAAPDIIVLVETDVSPWSAWVFKEGVHLADEPPLSHGVLHYERGAVLSPRHAR